MKPETLLHLFFESRIIAVIWNDVMEKISSKLRIPLGFRPGEVLFEVEGKTIKPN